MNLNCLLPLVFCLLCFLRGYSSDLQVTLQVKDEFGEPIAGVEGGISIFQRWQPGEGFGEDIHKQVNGITGTNGKATLKGSGRRSSISYGVRSANGYYHSKGGDYHFKTNVAGRWQPWNPTIDVVLRPVINPASMYARKFRMTIDGDGKKLGYDLIVGDWVTPDGKGTNADFVFEIKGPWKGPFDHDATLFLSFAGPHDGIQEFTIPAELRKSEFLSPREAPPDGYRQSTSWRRARKPGQPRKEQVDEPAAKKHYFFRVRTVVDELGNIKSALYGKVYEGFDFFGPTTKCFLTSGSCYLNPEPNSRNMEFDPKRNLAKGLKTLEGVSDP